jgi:thiol-disulfide isomerase/thioredoxin
MRKLLTTSLALFAIVSAGCAEEEVVDGEEVEELEEGQGQVRAEHVDVAYPAGPFGDEIGSIIPNFTFRGFARPQDGDFTPQTLRMSDFYNPTGTEQHAADSIYGAKPKPKAMLVIIAAAWCGPCQQEADQILPGEYEDFAPRGAEFFAVMAQNTQGGPPALKVMENWASKYDSSWPSVVDGFDRFFELAAEPAFPANILIDTRTMTIVDRVAGADPAIFAKMDELLDQ